MNNRKKIIELKNDISNLEIKIRQTTDFNERNALLAEKKKIKKDLKAICPKEFDMEENLKKNKREKQAIIGFQNFKNKVAIINQFNVATKRFISIAMNREQTIEKGKTKEFAA